jgi:hypothetical protein
MGKTHKARLHLTTPPKPPARFSVAPDSPDIFRDGVRPRSVKDRSPFNRSPIIGRLTMLGTM